MLFPAKLYRPRVVCVALTLTCATVAFAADAAEDEIEDLTKLPSFNVKADRLEEFGFRVCGMIAIPGTSYAMVSEIFPNTAASKAGLRPGELITRVDGKKRSMLSLLMLSKAQDRKWAELAKGKKTVSWSLDVHAPGTTEIRTVTMVIPTPAPHWGSARWQPPEGRPPAVVREPGPLATRAREVMDNGIWTLLSEVRMLGTPPQNVAPVVGYEWRIVQPSGTHRMWVTQQRGKTEILLEYRSRDFGPALFLTSPSGALDKAICRRPRRSKLPELSEDETRERFRTEVDFWLNKVGRVTGRWPFEALEGPTETIVMTGNQPAEQATPPPDSFLKLPVADDAQKALFADALGKVGADENTWAFTETSRAFGDSRVTTARFDPSQPMAERATLLKVDGKPPKAADLKRWRDEGHGVPAPMGELPAISSIADVNDVRVFADEGTAWVFELPLKGTELSPEHFQALFRVNKTSRAFEDFSVKLRHPMPVAGVAKITDAGIEVRFRTLDPELAPLPVTLKAGAGARVMLVKFSRTFEATRTDFKRVDHHE